MPFVQITLARGRHGNHVGDIADAVHRALVEAFRIPESDRFQVVREVEPDELIFPDSYLDIPHTDGIVYVHITAKEGRTTAMKRSLFASIARSINERTGLSPDDVVIVLSENKRENWSFGRGLAQLADGH